MTLDAVEFIRRFLLHVLPSGLVRIRHFGFLANRVRKQKLIQCRALLAASAAPIPSDPDSSTSEDPLCCPICRLGRLIVIELISIASAPIQDTSRSAPPTPSSLPSPVLPRASGDLCLNSISYLPSVSLHSSTGVGFAPESASPSPSRSFLTAHAAQLSSEKPFNTQRLVPASFNEFYRQCSRPLLACPHDPEREHSR